MTPRGMLSPTAKMPQVTTMTTAITARATISSFVLFIPSSPVVTSFLPGVFEAAAPLSAHWQATVYRQWAKIANYLLLSAPGHCNDTLVHWTCANLHPDPGCWPFGAGLATYIVVFDGKRPAVDLESFAGPVSAPGQPHAPANHQQMQNRRRHDWPKAQQDRHESEQ